MCDDDEFTVEVGEDSTEYLGAYATLEEYFVDQLEPFVEAPLRWLLECLDMDAVRRRFEGDRWTYFVVDDRVYRRPRGDVVT